MGFSDFRFVAVKVVLACSNIFYNINTHIRRRVYSVYTYKSLLSHPSVAAATDVVVVSAVRAPLRSPVIDNNKQPYGSRA